MDTPSGLLVPNVKDVARLSLLEVAQELSRLQGLASAGKLGAADLKAGARLDASEPARCCVLLADQPAHTRGSFLSEATAS
jgi:hypothetical protein